MSGKASGVDTGGATNRSHAHSQGNQSRSFTPEQKTAVIRVRKCSATAFYEILAIERTSTDGEIKKAYRKLSLLTHPDKNGYDGADEAFKMVSRAFQVLSDPDKKARFDKFGGDPDSRFGAGSAPSPAANPFAGFTRTSAGAGAGGPFGGAGGGRGAMFDEELTAEELFNRFFGGGGGGFGGFGDGGNVFFSMGGGPGIRVHQFGGRPRRRPAGANGQEAEEPQSPLGVLANMLPLLILFAVTILSSFLGSFGETKPRMPGFRYEKEAPYTTGRTMPNIKVPYWLKPDEVDNLAKNRLAQIDIQVEQQYLYTLRKECEYEQHRYQVALNNVGWWVFKDEKKEQEAEDLRKSMKSCDRLQTIRKKYSGL